MSMLVVCRHCLLTFSKKYISKVRRTLVVKFHVKQGKAACCFWADWIGTLVALVNIKLVPYVNPANHSLGV